MRRVGIVPAAGRAARLRSHLVGSKEMQVVAGRPVIDFLLERFDCVGVDEIRVVTRAEKDDVCSYVSGRGASVMLGRPPSAEASIARALAGLDARDVVLVGFPDSIWEPVDGFEPVARAVEEARADVALGLFDFDEPTRSHVVTADEEGFVVSIEVGPRRARSKRVWGCLAARAGALAPLGEKASWTSLFDGLVARRQVAGVYLSDVLVDIGTPESLSAYRSLDYEDLCARARSRAAAFPEPEG